MVLPAALWGEKTGTFTNVDRTVHISHKAVEPPGEARSDLDIFLDFARRMDFRDKDGKPLVKWKDAEGAFKHWARRLEGLVLRLQRPDLREALGRVRHPVAVQRKHPDGCERIYTDLKFRTAADECETFGHDLETGHARSRPTSTRPTTRPAGRCSSRPTTSRRWRSRTRSTRSS